MTGGVWAVVVAGGTGARYGGAKQFEDLGGRPVIAWAVDAAAKVADGVVVVVPEPRRDVVIVGARTTVGGATRADSVRAGLAEVPDDAEVIVVHDAARPLASTELFEAVIAALADGADGAVPGLRVPDTVKRVVDERGTTVVAATVDRDSLVAVQTPQAFRAAALRAAHASGDSASDDAALVERAGGRVVVVPGEDTNRKITTAADLDVLRSTLGS